MQFRILPVAVALLAVVVCVSVSGDKEVDALHYRCHHHHMDSMIAENEEVDVEAEKEAFPTTYTSMGWHKYKSGKCSYKRDYADCPHRKHWHHDEDHWDRHYGHKRLGHSCTSDSQCCSRECLQVRNTTAPVSVCCNWNTLAWNANCTLSADCCSGRCGNTTVGGQKVCLEPARR